MKIIIGIISYLPEEERIRTVRIKKLKALIEKCDKIFNLPILIIAQNWKDVEKKYNINSKNLIIHHYKKLGIVGARKKLRENFLNKTDADYIILLDDDCELKEGKLGAGELYLDEIRKHPNGWGYRYFALLKLAAISRFVFEQQDFLDINPEKSEGFEDNIFRAILDKRFKKYYFEFKDKNLWDFSSSGYSPDSTWRNEYKDTLDLERLMENTKRIVNKIKEEG